MVLERRVSMTENEAIKVINDKYETFFALSTTNVFDIAMATAIKTLEEIQQYRAIGTIEEFKALKEKSVAKKPIERERNYLTVFDCPTCNAELYSGQRYCDECGQAILDDYE